jgi:hypothetical protein
MDKEIIKRLIAEKQAEIGSVKLMKRFVVGCLQRNVRFQTIDFSR